MLALLRTQNPIVAILLFVYTLLTRLDLYQVMAEDQAEEYGIIGRMVGPLKQWLLAHNEVWFMLSVLSIFGMALLIQSLAESFRLTENSGFIVAFIFLTITAFNPSISLLNEGALLSWVFIGVVYSVFKLSPTPIGTQRELINIGGFLAILSLAHPNLLCMILLGLLAVVLLRSSHFRELVLVLLAYGVTMFIIGCLLFLNDDMDVIRPFFKMVSRPLKLSQITTLGYLAIGSVIVLLVFGIVNLNAFFNQLVIHIRRYWLFSLLSGLILTVLLSATFATINSFWILCLIPLTYFISRLMIFSNSRLLANLSMYYLLVLLILIKFFPTY